jgi:hypothetical protein
VKDWKPNTLQRSFEIITHMPTVRGTFSARLLFGLPSSKAVLRDWVETRPTSVHSHIPLSEIIVVMYEEDDLSDTSRFTSR